MIPDDLTPHSDFLAIYKGAKWEHPVQLTAPGGAPLDLTGLTPFVFTFKKADKDTFLVNVTVTEGDITEGFLTFSLTAAQTDLLRLGPIRGGLRDNLNNAYAEGLTEVKFFTPDPQ